MKVGTARAQTPAPSSTPAYAAGTAEKSLDIINLYDLETQAAKVIPKAPFGYISGGSGDEWTLRENTRAPDDYQILPRYLAGFDTPNTETELFGSKLRFQFLLRPWQRTGLPMCRRRGAARKELGCGRPCFAQTLANVPLEDIAKANPGPKWFQLYFMKDQGVNRELIQSRARREANLAATGEAQSVAQPVLDRLGWTR